MNAKTLTDRNGKKVAKSTVVHFKEGWARISMVFTGKQTVNLCGIFNGRTYAKQVPLADIYEDEAAWYASWQKSEAYQSM